MLVGGGAVATSVHTHAYIYRPVSGSDVRIVLKVVRSFGGLSRIRIYAMPYVRGIRSAKTFRHNWIHTSIYIHATAVVLILKKRYRLRLTLRGHLVRGNWKGGLNIIYYIFPMSFTRYRDISVTPVYG